MRYILSSPVLFALFVTLPAMAQDHGGGHDAGGHGGFPTPQISFHAVNFILLIALLVWLVGGRVREALADRSATVRLEIEEAQKMREEALSRYHAVQGQIANLQAQVGQMRAEAEHDAAAEAAAIAARAERDAQSIAQSAERTIRDEGLRARQALRREAAELAVKIAGDQLQQRITPADNARLNQEFISAVQNGGTHG